MHIEHKNTQVELDFVKAGEVFTLRMYDGIDFGGTYFLVTEEHTKHMVTVVDLAKGTFFKFFKDTKVALLDAKVVIGSKDGK